MEGWKLSRKYISLRTRFEVFKRDSFRCRYCGAPGTAKQLEIDHVVPVAAGGSSDADNLVASCHRCNSGKSAVPLWEQALKRPPTVIVVREVHHDTAFEKRTLRALEHAYEHALMTCLEDEVIEDACGDDPFADDMGWLLEDDE